MSPVPRVNDCQVEPPNLPSTPGTGCTVKPVARVAASSASSVYRIPAASKIARASASAASTRSPTSRVDPVSASKTLPRLLISFRYFQGITSAQPDVEAGGGPVRRYPLQQL